MPVWAVAALWAAGFLLLLPRRFPLRRGPGASVSVSVIIPARNEERVLPVLLGSLASQDLRPLEVIVVDDGSTDGTAGVAERAGARRIEAGPLPAGWRGKAWACQQGAAAARGDVLVFLDADTALEPGGLRAMVGALLAAPGPLSVCPWHAVEKPYEELSAFFNLAMAAGAGRFGLLGRRLGGGGLFGPSLLVRRADYERVGGHAAVRGQILEHFFLARQFAAGGITVRSAQGRGVLRVRMYPGGLRALAHGWGKAFAAGAAGTSPAALALTVAWLAGAVAAAAGLAFGGPEQASRVALYALYALQLALLLRALGGFRLMTAALYPVPLAFYFLVFAWSAGQRWTGAAVSWKGRRVTTGRAPDAV